MKRSFLYRSHQRNKRILRLIKRFNWHNWWHDNPEKQVLEAKKLVDNPRDEQCDCCSNPRKSKKYKHRRYIQLTFQEKKDLDFVKDSIEELE